MTSKKVWILPVISAAICSFAAVTVPTAKPVRPGGVILSGQCEAMPHSGYSALVATEKENYVPLCVDLAGQADANAGFFRLEYYPYFSKKTEILLWQSGQMALKLTETTLTLQIGEEKFTSPAGFQMGVWYDLNTSWENGKLEVKVDGRCLITVEKNQFPIATSITLGGMPDGLLRNIVFDRPRISPVTQLAGTPVEFTIRANNASCFSFDFFAHGEAVKLLLRPRLAIAPGDRLFLIQSGGDPMIITAEKSGEVTVDLPPSYSNRIELRPDPGNLLADAQLEQFPAKWQVLNLPGLPAGSVSGKNRFPVEKAIRPENRTDSAEPAEIDGRKAVILKRQRDVGYMSLTTSVAVKPATQYLLTLYHKNISSTDNNSSFLLMVTILENGKIKQTFKEHHPFTPLRRSGKWEIAPLMFRTANVKGNLTAKIELISDGSPCEIAVENISLREYPVNVYQPMPREIDREKILTGQALIDHLDQREPVKLPTIPASAVTGNDGNVYKMMNRAGADLLFVKMNIDHRRRHPAWSSDGKYDFSALDELILHTLSYAPDAAIGICIGIDPPLDFGIVFPDAAWRDINGKIVFMPTIPDLRYYPERQGKKYPFVSYTAPDFRRECGKFLFAFGEHLKKQPWGKAVAAIHLFGGGDGQWFYRPVKNDLMSMMDRSPGNLAAMQEALRRYYRNDQEALRKAWGEKNVTFETISFPDRALYKKHRYLLDPDTPEMRKMIDFAKLYPETVNAAIGFCATEFERGLGRKVLKSRYYFGTSLGNLFADSPFDMLVSVPPYGVSRLHGAAGRIHQAPGSAGFYGKYFLNELDLRTSYSPVAIYGHNSFRQNGVEPGPEGFANMMRKMAAPALVANQGFWYLMIGGNPSLQGEFEAPVKESFDALKYGQLPGVELTKDAAFFWDEEARTMMDERFGWAMDQHGTHQAQKILTASGVGFQMYLLKDLTHPARKTAKLNIFALGTTMNEEQISFIEKNLQKDNNVLVFVFDAGRTAPGGFEKNIHRLTGINVRSAGMMGLSCFSPLRFSDPLSKYMLNAAPLTSTPFALPLYFVDDPDAKPLALLARTDLVGAAIKRHKNWTAVYISLPLGLAVKPEFIRALAAEAGITPVAPLNDFTSAGNSFIVIHAASNGEKVLQWDNPADVLDMTTGKIIARKVKTLTVKMKFGETRWFRMLKPAE